jgi:hypothetical protein
MGKNIFPISGSGKMGRRSSSIDTEALDSDGEEELLGALGQLSINEDEQIRYHGKASGIYLLRNKERLDQRNEGDIWSVTIWLFSIFSNDLCSAGDFQRHASGPLCPVSCVP